MYSIFLSSRASLFLKRLDKHIAKRVMNKIESLKENPNLGKPLVGNLSGSLSLRIGDYRAIYQIQESRLLIFVIEIGHRKRVYG